MTDAKQAQDPCPEGTVYTNPKEWLEYTTKLQKIARNLLGIEDAEKKKRDRLQYEFGCTCDDFDPVEATGYDGKIDTACRNCCEVCPRCHLPATNIDYSTTGWDKSDVCQACAVGDHDEAASACSEEEEEEEEEKEEEEEDL